MDASASSLPGATPSRSYKAWSSATASCTRCWSLIGWQPERYQLEQGSTPSRPWSRSFRTGTPCSQVAGPFVHRAPCAQRNSANTLSSTPGSAGMRCTALALYSTCAVPRFGEMKPSLLYRNWYYRHTNTGAVPELYCFQFACQWAVHEVFVTNVPAHLVSAASVRAAHGALGQAGHITSPSTCLSAHGLCKMRGSVRSHTSAS